MKRFDLLLERGMRAVVAELRSELFALEGRISSRLKRGRPVERLQRRAATLRALMARMQ